MALTIIKKVSLSEFLQLPETEPASEYIDGEIIPKPMAQEKHSSIQIDPVMSSKERSKFDQSQNLLETLISLQKNYIIGF